MPRTILICEPQPIVLAGLKAVLADCEDLVLSGHTGSIGETPIALAERKPDIVLLGHAPSARTVLSDLPRVIEASPTSHIVLWLVEAAELDCLRALQLGVKGVLRKTAPVASLLRCLRSVSEGQIWLEEPNLDRSRSENRRTIPRMTPRERQITELVCRGLKNKEIASALSITPGTVKVHLMHIFEKTGVKDRFQLALHGRHLSTDPVPGVPEETESLPRVHSVGW